DLFTPIIFTSAIVLSFALGLLLFDGCQDYLFPLVLKIILCEKIFHYLVKNFLAEKQIFCDLDHKFIRFFCDPFHTYFKNNQKCDTDH
ncbi:hypothetical protein KZ447_10395, partial [Glaesserella parasuis]|nr:hypothetical protein [Glaesserella parasuis]